MTTSEVSRQRTADDMCPPLAEAGRKRRELVRRGRWQEADDLTERALREALGGPGGPELAQLTYLPGAQTLGHEDDGRPGPGTAARAGALRALHLANRGLNRAEAVRRAGLVLGSRGRDDVGGFWAAALTLLHANELPSVIGACARAAAEPVWSRSAPHRDALALLRARTWAVSGRLPKAVSAFGRIRERGMGTPLAAVAAAWHAEALSATGRHRQAYVTLHECGFDGAGGQHPERAQLLAARSAAHLAAGNFQLGLEDALACGEHAGVWGVRNPAVLPWRSLAALCASALGRSPFAVLLARQEYELASRWGTGHARGVALHALGVALRDAGGVAALLEAQTALSGSYDTLYLARVRYSLGCLLLSLGRGDEAGVFLEGAADAGFPPWSAYAAATVRRLAGGGRAPSLTEQEKRVARRALTGRTNKEIALDLHLTARTVEFHLSNTYHKLGIRGREELVTAALLIG
ncbi:helix-turn-helix transcriptional regulator [Streptomyces roseirectus]|uniref:Helix-turn-helix transcriptional regulator n=1 Tax=Streptomyces roseirectus TaxID=2768066 RepID=A0A7H0IR14_9ACTN|nr:helix-turn-helix transcriptional regulator [Streptomyces roseirectus]QNP75230.1 helix-turn-helix transcriptional regulator [Streptomyces roseirectus]